MLLDVDAFFEKLKQLEHHNKEYRRLLREFGKQQKVEHSKFESITKKVFDILDSKTNIPIRQKRKVALFVLVYLFYPSSFSLRRLQRGARNNIAKAIGCSHSAVSHDFMYIEAYYSLYASFRNDVNSVLEEICTIL